MKKIPLLDLTAQLQPIREEVLQAVERVIDSGQYIMGPEVKAFEKEVAQYLGVKHAIGVGNGTDALLLALDAAGIKAGDEVITTPFTFFATAETISQVGATPVFVDIDPKTYNIDVNQIKEKINEKTKAIIPVHIFGQPANMEEIMALAEEHQLFVLEDAAQGMGSEYKGRKIGNWGHAATFSFFPTKNLGGYGDGGMVVTNDDQLAEKIRILRVHGSNPKYYHSMIGYNSRLDALQAAVLRIKLRHLDAWNDGRRKKAALYNELLKDTPVVTPYEAEDRKHIYHLYIIQAEDRDELMAHLKEQGISCGVYYPVPLHQQEVYKDLGYEEGSLPVSEYMAKRTFALPLYAELEDEDIRLIANTIKSYYANKSK
ncbi:DegT/DnrJ/EryC1/StrS family aminotransferase [Thermoactinomyces intermedius]|jgi:dTDP-4-amino-4,6-dideoxygalactose transaminase|uniref:DegT/DnrJ/EryC1/StrS family aminotransferase n=1 Tax=Thermoactinomyces intermedius TaxID=2024 RepID=A0A8I1A977_THEIN|nr:DegT/DnrJ/EryC1/StrS family aminotransferase [Thermoactinomyces intermedius]MBA4548167.1 DegT/DnrJ/EryC1/StrS family aminotransferase [Thermoactinomyces intermedius]MBA4835269.1 DegT/DnrJ/EryC1/StrS family aminotransferase [Thermoactinomyces intermedius]MBH8595011.1 DegT/DnrJ/EryC1/StrS family aminotransferase [Thermoactinomyces intermedius]